MKSADVEKVFSVSLILMFSIVIFVPMLIGIVEKDKISSKVEFRRLQKFPETPKTVLDVSNYPDKFDSYYSDHVGLRDAFVKFYNSLKLRVGDSPSRDVILGKDGWLFLGSVRVGYDRQGDPVGDFRGKNLYSEEQLQTFVTYLTNVEQWLHRRGIEYVLIIAPNKHSIYFDKLPNYISSIHNGSAMDQLVGYLKTNTGLNIIDPRPTLKKEKNKFKLYYQIDTHWNYRAGNLVQYQVFKELERLFPGKIQPTIYKLKEKQKKGGDLARFIGLNSLTEIVPHPVFKNECEPIWDSPDVTRFDPHTINCEGQQLTALIFRDSFFTVLKPYFSRNFLRSTYIWERLNYDSLAKYIDREKPDIVIEEFVERALPFVPKNIDDFLK